MSDDLDIRGGGVVAVDTATLRTVARGFEGLAGELGDIAAHVGSTGARLFELSPATWDASATIEVVRRRILTVIEDADGIAEALRLAADVYDIVELRSERAAAQAAGDEAAVVRMDARLAAAVRAHPEADRQAGLGALAHWFGWPVELTQQSPGMLWWLAPGFHSLAIPFAWSVQRAIGASGAATIPSTAVLRGESKEVIVTPVPNRGATGAPVSLAEAAARIPQGDTRIRVERYTMPDGTRRFAVYVAGTRTMQPSTSDPFDMGSNVELYTGERSASYDATLAALADAGAEPGDVVHAFGHSQGAMVNAHVALEGSLRHSDPRLARVARRGGCRRPHPQHRAAAQRRPRDRARRRRSHGCGRRARQLHRPARSPTRPSACTTTGCPRTASTATPRRRDSWMPRRIRAWRRCVGCSTNSARRHPSRSPSTRPSEWASGRSRRSRTRGRCLAPLSPASSGAG